MWCVCQQSNECVRVVSECRFSTIPRFRCVVSSKSVSAICVSVSFFNQTCVGQDSVTQTYINVVPPAMCQPTVYFSIVSPKVMTTVCHQQCVSRRVICLHIVNVMSSAMCQPTVCVRVVSPKCMSALCHQQCVSQRAIYLKIQ